MLLPSLSRRVPVTFGFAALCLSLIANLWTISSFPSWFDEAFFANISFNVSRGFGRLLDLIPGYASGEVNIYGPLYFDIQSLLVRAHGLSSWIFRIPNLASGYLAIVVLIYVLRIHHVKTSLTLMFGLACSLDVSVNRVLVSGRMDLISVLFIAVALLLVSIKTDPYWKHALLLLLAGLSVSVAYLITPRSFFLLPVVALVGFRDCLRSEHSRYSMSQTLTLLTIGFASFALPVAVWIHSVGGINEYISYFTNNETVGRHISPSFFRSFYDNIAIVAFLVLSALNIKLISRSSLLMGLFSTYISFSLFVREVGPYAGMIMPFVLMAIFLIMSTYDMANLYRYSILIVLISPGALLAITRLCDLLANQSCRDPRSTVNAVEQYIEEHKIAQPAIVAPFKYYFQIAKNSRNLYTTEMTRLDPALIYRNADIVVGTPDDIARHNLSAVFVEQPRKITCKPTKLPLLTSKFLERSTYTENVYARTRPEGKSDQGWIHVPNRGEFHQ